jgi:hypothetical protein
LKDSFNLDVIGLSKRNDIISHGRIFLSRLILSLSMMQRLFFSDLQNFCISTFDFLDLGVGTGFKKKKSKRWPHLLDY